MRMRAWDWEAPARSAAVRMGRRVLFMGFNFLCTGMKAQVGESPSYVCVTVFWLLKFWRING
jgi:hypothetical protein